MNRLCESNVLAEDKLFATLDPTTRSFRLSDGREALLIDTVGFIRKLPHELVEAFKSTLEEAVYADMLIHVVDASNEEAEEQVKVVNDILESLGAANKPVIMALNKMDMVKGGLRLAISNPNGRIFEISAVTGQGIDAMLEGIREMLPEDEKEVRLFIPYSDGWVISYIYQTEEYLSKFTASRGPK